MEVYERLAIAEPYRADGEQIARRSLRNAALAYLAAAGPAGVDTALAQYQSATNMTDRLVALRAIAVQGSDAQRDTVLEDFYQAWQQEALVVNQWLQLQSSIPGAGALERVQALMEHPAFELRNPNKVRALVGNFANNNPVNFHRLDGEGYRFLADIVAQLDPMNPQIAARLLSPLTKWRNYEGRGELMRAELQRLAARPGLSPDVFEVLTRSLEAAG